MGKEDGMADRRSCHTASPISSRSEVLMPEGCVWQNMGRFHPDNRTLDSLFQERAGEYNNR